MEFKMEVEWTVDLGEGHRIEGGRPSWGGKTRSIRDRYPTRNGGFSPRSSSEIPMGDVELLVTCASQHGELSNIQRARIIRQLAADMTKALAREGVSPVAYDFAMASLELAGDRYLVD
jgi:hypothetical protein